MRADEGSECLRHGASAEAMRSGELWVQMVREPLPGFMLLPLGTVAVPTGMVDAVLALTVGALREAMAVRATWTLLEGTDDLAVREGQLGVALPVFWRTGGEEVTEGGHESSPCMRVLRRSEASACPLWGRWRSSMVVSSWVGPR
jgi:hypothetical protein